MTQTLAAYTIAETAERIGVSAHTLRYYERIGALREPPARDAGGHRRYNDRDIEWITLLTRFRSTGMPISILLRYAALARDGDATAADRKALLIEHRAALRARIAQLNDDLAMIDYKIDVYDDIERRRLG